MDNEDDRLNNAVEVVKQMLLFGMNDLVYSQTGLVYHYIVEKGALDAFVQAEEENIRKAIRKKIKEDKLDRDIDLIYQYARREIPLIITGETGTGKELLVKVIHALSPRCNKRLKTVNAAQFTETLFDDEMFGHVKGAYTGASRNREGLLMAAHEGTFFIDELGKMPIGMQAKLLRVIEDGKLRQVGADKTTDIDIRYIVAFREDEKEGILPDLRYRLGFPDCLSLSNYKERFKDLGYSRQLIDILEEMVIAKIKPQHNHYSMSDDFIQTIAKRKNKGNYREIENILRLAIIHADAFGEITLSKRALPEEDRGEQSTVIEKRDFNIPNITLSEVETIDHCDIIRQIEKKKKVTLTLDMEKIALVKTLEYVRIVSIIIIKYIVIYVHRNSINYKNKIKDGVHDYSGWMSKLKNRIGMPRREWLEEYIGKFAAIGKN